MDSIEEFVKVHYAPPLTRNNIDTCEFYNILDDTINNRDSKDKVTYTQSEISTAATTDNLDEYYFTNLVIDNYKNMLYNLDLKVYKNLPQPVDFNKYSTLYFDMDNDYFILKNRYIFDITPLWLLFSKDNNL